MSQGIDFKDLPKTFQHALVVTRELKCRFIWIDSLCIIQDSHQDWLKESSQMDQIYSNSFCNIAASAAENSTKGLFFQRHPGSIVYFRITINQIVYLIESPHINPSGMLEQSPLNYRGWVYQERFLSKRILHFTVSQLFWECKTHSTSETYHETDRDIRDKYILPPPYRLNNELDGLYIRRRDGGSIYNIAEDAFLDAFAVWKEIVSRYSHRHLTQETDRLVAISGVAAKMYEILDDDYLAGVWRKHLPYSLTWQAMGENKRPTTYTGPSWSWASITGRVQKKALTELEYEHCVEIIYVDVGLAGPSKFGQVTSGIIKLKGSLMAILLSICRSSDPERSCIGCTEDSDTLNFRFALDISRPGVDRFEENRERLHFPISRVKGMLLCHPTKTSDHPLVYGLPIVLSGSEALKEVEGLLLEPTGNNSGEFRRIGRFSKHRRYHKGGLGYSVF